MDRPASTAAGSLGPRLAGRLTADTILRSPQYMSCIGLYHLDLRDNRLNAIENLGATQNQFDCIDMSGNNIIRLEGFPKLPRLKMLLCCSNRISTFAPGLDQQIPELETLILTNNKIDKLSDLDVLAAFKKLTHLSLLENPVAKNTDFRLYAIYRLKKLKVLNFKKVSVQEREKAQAKFVAMSLDEVQHQASAQPLLMIPEARPGEAAEPAEMTAAQRMAVQVAITNAATMEEVHRLESALKAGRMPEALPEDTNGATVMDEG